MRRPPLVTISASYGAGGSRVGPLLAQALDVDFVERAIPRHVAAGLESPLAEARLQDQHAGRSLGRLLRQLTPEVESAASARTARPAEDDDEYRRASDHEILHRADDGAVILGRAGAVVLRDVPHALHVRMSGPRDLRIEQALLVEGIDRDTARWRQAEGDHARDTYVRHFYGVDPLDESLYHMVLDSTRLPLAACVQAIASAALELAAAENL